MFRKGESANSGGRPKGSAELRDLARQHAPEAVGRLVRIMRTGEDRIAATAAGTLLDRGFGRPVPVLDGDGDDGSLVVVLRGFTDQDGNATRTDLPGRPAA